jgi:hypothetical protein
MKAPAIASCFCVALACVIATSAICAPAPAPQVDVAYDIVARVIVSGTPPPPDSFAADADRIAKLPPYHFNSGPAAPSMAAGRLTGLISAIPGVGSFLFASQGMTSVSADNRLSPNSARPRA